MISLCGNNPLISGEKLLIPNSPPLCNEFSVTSVAGKLVEVISVPYTFAKPTSPCTKIFVKKRKPKKQTGAGKKRKPKKQKGAGEQTGAGKKRKPRKQTGAGKKPGNGLERKVNPENRRAMVCGQESKRYFNEGYN